MANLQPTSLVTASSILSTRRFLRPSTLLLSLVLLAAPMTTLRAQSIVTGTDPVPVGEPFTTSATSAYPIFALMLLGMA